LRSTLLVCYSVGMTDEILHVTEGPCETRLSFLCEGTGVRREYPLDMLAAATSFQADRYRVQCLPCYERAADLYVGATHGLVEVPADILNPAPRKA